MSQDDARAAAVAHALARIEPGMTIGLGSGRAVFALAQAIGNQWSHNAPVRAVVASPRTGELAATSGIQVIGLTADTDIALAFDGADEVDHSFRMIKGGGAALLTEKLVLASAREVVIMVEDVKIVDRLGMTRLLPVEVVQFGWSATRARLLDFVPSAELRINDSSPVITSQGHYLVDVTVPDGDLDELASRLKLTLGVIDHGLFLDHCDELIVGNSDGSIETRRRSTLV